jgi:phosphoadenosine phosphosulfate reductase
MSMLSIKTLCGQYSQANHRDRLVAVFRDFDRVLVTSSFGTTSVILLHMLHQVKPNHPVHFVDTGYHFRETLDFAERLKRMWNLNLVLVRPGEDEHARTRQQRSWEHQADLCCKVNKVNPLKALKRRHEVWISGMLGGTNAHRKSLPMFKQDGELLRFYPLIDMTPDEAEAYQVIYDLPKHPLSAKGYGSIGCSHCTQKGEGRSGRWAGRAKTECGLHLFK